VLKQSWLGIVLSSFVIVGPVALSYGPPVAAAEAPAVLPPLSSLEQLLAPIALYPDAQLAGNLKPTPQQSVTTETQGGHGADSGATRCTAAHVKAYCNYAAQCADLEGMAIAR
jgi:hypothetical protein